MELLGLSVLSVIGATGHHPATNLRDQRSLSAIRSRDLD
jgi:hypothetical protein